MSFADEYSELRKKRKKSNDEAVKEALQTYGDSRVSENFTLKTGLPDYEPTLLDKIVGTFDSNENAKEREDTVFKKGAFDDGYQFGDVAKTILGTAGDIGVGVAKGFVGSLEGLTDLLWYGVAGVSKAVGDDDFALELRELAQKSQTDQLLGGAENFVNKASVLGDKADAIPAGLGQILSVMAVGGMGQAAGLGKVGTTAVTTGFTGTTAMGGAMSEAYQGGATDEEALQHGLQVGAIEAGTELLFGGLGKTVNAVGLSKGIGGLDDMFARKISSKISNQFFKNATEFGIKASAEGLEEVLAGIGTAVSKKLTYMSDEELSKLIKDENLLEQFVVGAVTSGIAQSGYVPGTKSGSLREANQEGRDFITGNTANEQKVIDKEYANRVAEEEKSGKKLTGREKTKLYEQVQKDLEKGRISIDTIEETLGGEQKKAFDNFVKEEQLLKQEIAHLEQTEGRTERMENRLQNAKRELAELQKYMPEYKEAAKNTIYEMAKGDRLVESYNERARRSQAFEADLSQYDAKQAEIIKKAIDSGILNNTNRTHEFVDMIAKISADKGVSFDFTNNEKLKESGFAVDGAFVNGYLDKKNKTIGVNINSAKALNTVVGHEVTHILEGTELYSELQTALFDYAKTKKDFDARRKALEALYSAEDVDTELAADLVGDYLFTDEAFIANLSTKHRNVFQKIYDEIKYLCKVATAGSKEARELERVKRAFEKAYRESGKAQTDAKGDAKYSLTPEQKKADADYLDAVNRGDTATAQKMVDDAAKRAGYPVKAMHGTKKFGFTSIDLSQSDDGISFFATDSEETAQSYASGSYVKRISDKAVEMTEDEMLDRQAEVTSLAEDLSDYCNRTLGIRGWVDADYFATELDKCFDALEFGGSAKSVVEGFNGFCDDLYYSFLDNYYDSQYENNPWIDESEKVTFDYFESSEEADKLADEFYSYVGKMTDKLKSLDNSANLGVYDLYVNTDNHLVINADGSMWNKLDVPTLPDIKSDEYSKYGYRYHRDSWTTRSVAAYAKDSGYSGVTFKNIVDGGEGGDVSPATVYIFFDPQAQVKSADAVTYDDNGKVIPLSERFKAENNDIRYSLSDSDGKQLTKEQSEYFKDSKVRDENGNLKVMYHGTPNGDFTVFKDGTYFTENKEYADLYQNPGASSISTGKVASNPKTFEVYLDIKKPFDISDAEARSIYINDYIKGGNAVGINPYLSDAEYDKIKTIDWTEGEDLREFLIDNGYDYDGLVLDEGATGGYGEDVKDRGKSYVVFSPEQVKNVDNLKPTSDKDIRFSLSKAVEESGELMALHNLHTNEVLKQLSMGGMPYPSVAITNPSKIAHEGFGEITVILKRDAIDPKKSKYNRIYGADAYTPTFPSVDYVATRDVADTISSKVIELYDSIPEYYKRSLTSFRDYTNIDDVLNSARGEIGMLERYADDHGFKQLYLAEKGEVVPVEIQRTEKRMTDAQKEMYQFVVDGLGADVLKSFAEKGDYATRGEAKVAWFEKHGDALENVYADFFAEDLHMTKEEALEIAKGQPKYYWVGEIKRALEFMENGGITVEETEDFNATNAKIDAKVDSTDYKRWLSGLFGGIEESSGIRNGKGVFTPSGNRRSFAQTHDPVTIDNVIKAMRKKEQTGQGAFGSGNIQGSSAQEYKSIAEVKKNASRLGKMDDAEHNAITKRINDSILEIAGRYSNGKDIIDAKATICEAVSRYETKEGIANYLKQYDYVYKYTDSIGDDIIELRDYIRSLPTPYFEAKPRRAVGFDEVGVFVIPRNADAKLKQELLNRGYAIAEYDPDVEGDRQRVVNSFEEYKFSLSDIGETPKTYGNYNVRGEDVRLENIAPVQEDVAPVDEAVDNSVDEAVTDVNAVLPDNLAPMAEEEVNAMQSERLASLDDADMPPEVEAPYYGEGENVTVDDPFDDRDMKEVSKDRKVKAYMYENPEVKPFFQDEAERLLGELERTDKAGTIYNGWQKYEMSYEGAQDIPEILRIPRRTSPDIAYLLDSVKMSYADIEKGLKAIIEDNGAENIAAAKKIEFVLNDRLLNGYVDDGGFDVPPDQGYINLLNEKQIREYNEEARARFFDVADEYAPPADDIAPIAETKPDRAYEAIRPKPKKEPRMARIKEDEVAPLPTDETPNNGQNDGESKTAEVLTEEPESKKAKTSAWGMFKNNVLDKGMVFEDLSLATGNRELQARWNSIRYAENAAQRFMEKGNASTSSLDSIREAVESTGKTKEFYEYLYHLHNVDRMSLESKAAQKTEELRAYFVNLKIEQIRAIAAKKITDTTTEKTAYAIRAAKEYLDAVETKNKPVFGDSVTAEVSQEIAAGLEKANPEFKQFAQDVYGYMNTLREMLLENGVISRETADLWAEMYPHYVPIRRAGKDGLAINVPLDTGRTGVNAPIKRATGGNSDILPLFDTMGQRTLQTFKAIAKNRFGVELKNTLGTTIANEATRVDDAIDTIDEQDGLLQEGKNGQSPTFTVFEDGKKVTFEITEEMYDAMKPTSKGLSYTNKVANTAGNIFRGLLTEYNPVFMATNAVKDVQDILINSQHAAKTYASIPRAILQMATKGHYYQEYLDHGGEQNTYFDGQNNTFKAEDKGIKKIIGMPLRAISAANNFIERVPRLAEYIASRESGRSIDVSMLDAARVTTNFAAGGDLTKMLNRNGFTFLNASMQGAVQQARNIREAKANGLKGWVQLATKVALAGLPAILLNNLVWDDDEEYEELSDYVKDNYYVVAKREDGTFVRIPKGRTLAVIQNAFEQVSNTATGDDEADLARFLELAVSNLAPNNPLENNILAPIMQVRNNETWYGEDLVPTRLQDLPDAEQFDESTDSLSKWLGEKLNYSPYKINYLLNQYTGGVGDVFLPMMTPEAESGDNTFGGKLAAPWKDKFTTDSVMNNQNVSDFYDTVDELTKNANSMNATDEDVLKYKFMNSINSDLGELYQQKREIQNSNLSDEEKYEAVREIQEQINTIAKESLNAYNNVNIQGVYATVGDIPFRWYEPGEDSTAEPGWRKLTGDQIARQEKVTDGLGIDAPEYWSNKEEYDYAYDYPERYAVAQAVGGYKAFKNYSSELYDIKADKDEDGKSISGSRKEKVIDYVNNLDIDYGMRIILFKNEYNADDTYNYEIIDYLNSREDISYEEMETILKALGFTVSSDGNITWD